MRSMRMLFAVVALLALVGGWASAQPGSAAPRALTGATGVSRMTANRALRELNNEGYVERVAGVGTFVADVMAASHVLQVKNIADEIHERGHAHSSAVLRQDRIPAAGEVAKALHCDSGDDVFHELLRFQDLDLPY